MKVGGHVTDSERIISIVFDRLEPSKIIHSINENIKSSNEIHTDCYHTYKVLSFYGKSKPFAELEVSCQAAANRKPDLIRGFLAYFRRPFKSQHNFVSRDKLWMYLKEAEFRYNRRLQSELIFWDMISAFPILEMLELENLQQWNWKN